MNDPKLPDEIMVWRSSPETPWLGAWATTRYPEDAVAYVPAARVTALEAVPLAQVTDEALERAAAWCSAEADKCENAATWGGSSKYLSACKNAAYALRDAAANIRAMKGK